MFYKLRLWIGLSLFLFFALVLSACGAAGQPAADSPSVDPTENQAEVLQTPTSTSVPATQPAAEPVNQTPTAVQSLQTYTNLDYGFSLAYPSDFEVQSSFSHTIVFLAPPGTPGHRERAIMNVELTLDQTAEWYANQLKEDNAFLGIVLPASQPVIDGQQAYILGNVSGQDPNRQVFIVYKGILYHLTFFPDAPQAGEEYQQMETLYQAVIGSLHFMPERRDVPPVTNMNNMVNQLERAMEARSEDDMTRPLGDEFFVGYWTPNTPEGVTFDSLGRNAVTPFLLSTYLSPAPDLMMTEQADWTSMVGSADPFSAYFPNETITPVWVQGWGPQGSDEAALIIARRGDGSLYWRGMFVTQGTFRR